MLEHGGKLKQAAARYGIAIEEWLDLSTGINPKGWPVPTLPGSSWSRLPEDDDELEQVAHDYYGCENILPVAGSQAAIQILPMLRSSCHIGVLQPGYAEHEYAWQCAGHQVSPVTAEMVNNTVSQLDVLVLIHPNNPTGTRFSLAQLLSWHDQLVRRGGWLVVDEAFMDITPEYSLVSYSTLPGLIVLRSLGKFFGLAGARVGFVCAQAALLKQLSDKLGPWTVNSPARWVATAALGDHLWQQATRQSLLSEGVRLHTLLTQYGLKPEGGCALFQWVETPLAIHLHEKFARLGILTRLFTEPASLRFGLPGSEAEWQRLDSTLAQLTENMRMEVSA